MCVGRSASELAHGWQAHVVLQAVDGVSACGAETGDGAVSQAKEIVGRVIALCGSSKTESEFGPQHGLSS